MRKVDASAVAFAAISLVYPLLAAFLVRTVGPGWVVLALLALLALRGVFGLLKIPGALTIALIFVAAAMGFTALFDRELSVRLYPAFMNAAMLVAFAQTLWLGPSMIERFARLREPDLPEQGVRYTRAVTWLWVAAAWTALFASWELWTLYNGMIAYLAMGALFFGEMMLRPLFRGRARPNP
jgi:uncharacterized membrane protein